MSVWMLDHSTNQDGARNEEHLENVMFQLMP